jgi:Ribosomal protein L7/L12 C-terminal domain
MDDSENLRELSRRLDHIEQYLTRLGQATGFGYTPYRGTGAGATSFDTAPASFGPVSGFSDVAQSYVPPAGPGQSPGVTGMIGGVPAEIVELGRTRMIEAIKQYRALTGVGLKEAKDAVEAAVRAQR